MAPSPEKHVPLSRVFVATDFSEGAAHALSRVARLPLASHAKVSIIHVFRDRLRASMRAQIESAARERLDAEAAKLERTLPPGRHVQIAKILCAGQPHVEVIRRARSAGAELIVVGRHGHRPVRDLFLGSTASKIVRLGELPTLIVNRAATRPYRKPMIAVDCDDSARAVVAAACRVLAPATHDALMVHAYQVPFEGLVAPTEAARSPLRKEHREAALEAIARLQRSLSDVGLQWTTVLRHGDPRTVILQVIARTRADLLVMGTHGRTGIAHALIGSVAEWVVQAAVTDVLVARAGRISFELP